MLETLSDSDMDVFLKEQTIGRIGCHADGQTYVVPTSYIYEGQSIYCHAQEGMKINMMRQNPKVCFEVDAFVHSATWKSVIVWGRFEELTEEAERTRALQLMLAGKLPVVNSETLKKELGANYPYPPDGLANIKGVVFKISVDEKTGRQEMFENNYEFIGG